MKVTYEVVIIELLTERISDGFGPMFSLIVDASDWMSALPPLIEGYEYRVRKSTTELL